MSEVTGGQPPSPQTRSPRIGCHRARANREIIEALNNFDTTLPTQHAQQLARRFRLTPAIAGTVYELAFARSAQ